MNLKRQKVIDYFNSLESRLGYSLLLRGTKHFGYYPQGQENIWLWTAQRNMEQLLAQKLKLKPLSMVLDAGCGEGNVALYLAQNYGLNVTGVDLLKSATIKAKKKAFNLGLQHKVNFQVMDYQKLPFPNRSFDAVYTMETLVHAADYHRALTEFHRVLKPSGKLVLFEYSIGHENKLTPSQRYFSDLVIQGSAMHSLPHFSHGSFPQILRRAGFTHIKVTNLTQRMLPMLRTLYLLGYFPYKLIKLFRLQRFFINTTAVAEWYYPIINHDFWRYNLITATKP